MKFLVGENSRMKLKGIPHPSVTGMASGLAVAAYLNAGRKFNGGKLAGEGVIKDVTDGQLGQAFGTLSNREEIIKSQSLQVEFDTVYHKGESETADCSG